MSFATLAHQQKAAFIAGQCAARRDRWIQDARAARDAGFRHIACTFVGFARDNSHQLVRLLRRARR